MQTIGKIFAGIFLGMILSFVIGMVLFQGYLFERGSEYLGVGTAGLTYFVSGFIASLLLMFFPGARNWMRFIALYPITIFVVGSLALTGVMTEGAMTHEDLLFDVEQVLRSMLRAIGLMFFWGTPTVVTAIFSILYWSAKQELTSRPVNE